MPDYYLKLIGPTCPACTGSIKEALQKIQVSIVDIDITRLIVSVSDEAKLKEVINAIEERGFDATIDQPPSNKLANPAQAGDDLFPSLAKPDEKVPYFLYSAITFAIGLPLMIIGMLGMIPSPIQPIGQFIGIIFALVTAALVGFMTKFFFKSAWQEIKRKSPGMNTLFVLGASTAFLYSILVIALPGFFGALSGHADFSAVFIITSIVCFGQGVKNYLTRKTKEKAKNILNFKSLLEKWQPLYVDKRVGLELQKTYFKEIKPDDIIQISPELDSEGKIAPGRSGVDGVYIGNSPVEVIAPHTGESGECRRILQPNDEVLAGTQFILQPGAVALIKASKAGEDSSLYKRLRCAASTPNDPPPFPMVQKISRWFAPAILGVSLLSGILWAVLGPVNSMAYAIVTACSVLLCACPCAFALASPISTLIAAFKAMQKGIFIHKLPALEKAADITTVVFDKTGTLTDDVPSVQAAQQCWSPDVDLKAIWEALIAVESHPKAFSHPTSKAILKYAKESGFMNPNITPATEFEYQENKKGVRAQVGDHKIQVGQFDWFLEEGIVTREHSLYAKYQEIQETGASPVCIAQNGQWVGILPIKGSIKKGVKETILWLQSQKIKIKMLTGDEWEVAYHVARDLGIPKIDVLAKQLPHQKQQYIAQLKKEGEVVAMLGDGVNDIEAIKEADVGIAVEEGVDATVDPHVIFQHGDLSCLKTLMTISKKLKRNIKQNLVFAMAYNFLSIVVAAGLLFPILGILGNPVFASIAMGISSIIVILNAARLRGKLNNALDDKPVNIKTLKEYLTHHWKTSKPLTKGIILSAALSLTCISAGTICALACGMTITSLFSLSAMSSMMAFCGVMMMTGYVGLGIVAALLIALAIYKGVQYYKAHKTAKAAKEKEASPKSELKSVKGAGVEEGSLTNHYTASAPLQLSSITLPEQEDLKNPQSTATVATVGQVVTLHL